MAVLHRITGKDAGALSVDDGQPLDAGMPGLLGREVDHELHPAVGELGVRVLAVYAHNQLPLEGAVAVSGAQLACLLMPRALQVAPAHQPPAAHVEDIGEVRFDRQLQDQPDRVARKADQVIVLVHALKNRAVEAEADGALLEEDVVLGAISRPSERKLRRRELVASGKVIDSAGVEQQRKAAIDRDRVAGDETRVPSEEPHTGSRHHGAVRLADQELVVVVDRDGRRALRNGHLDSPPS